MKQAILYLLGIVSIFFVLTSSNAYADEVWREITAGIDEEEFHSISVAADNPQKAHIVTSGGVYTTEDGGDNWKKLFSQVGPDEGGGEVNDEATKLSLLPKTWSVARDPSEPDNIYLGTDEGVFESRDNGQSWQEFNDDGLVSRKIDFLLVPPSEPFTMYAATQKGVFKFSKDEDVVDGPNLGVSTNYKLLNDFNFGHEPSILEIQNAAISYAEVHPQKIDKWRKAARKSAFLPRLSFGIDKDKSDSLHWDAGANPDTWVIGPEDEDTGWDIDLTWDLGDLIWNEDQTQIDVRSKLMVQLRDDILDEVNRYYFERKKLQIELAEFPPENNHSRIQKELRIQELTANLDALTGGFFSDNLE